MLIAFNDYVFINGKHYVRMSATNAKQYLTQSKMGNRENNLISELLEALKQWKCPACGGSKTYRQEWSQKYPDGFEGTCRKCDGQGLHPIAQAAIMKAQERKTKPRPHWRDTLYIIDGTIVGSIEHQPWLEVWQAYGMLEEWNDVMLGQHSTEHKAKTEVQRWVKEHRE